MYHLPILKGAFLYPLLLITAVNYSQEINDGLPLEEKPLSRDTAFVTEVITLVSSTAEDGKLAQHSNDKNIFYEAHIKNKKLHGNWQSWYAGQKKRDSGRFVKGIPHGEWKAWNEEGQLIAVRHFSAEVFQSIRHEVVRYHPKTSRFSLSKYYHTQPSFYKSAITAFHTFLTAGYTYLPVYKAGLHHGIFINYEATGQVRDSGHYSYGLRNGVWRLADAGNEYWTGAYSQGVKEKEWKLYNANGRLIRIEYYSRGKQTGFKEFDNR